MNWKPGDNPESEHKLYFPHCDFHQRKENNDAKNGITVLIILKNYKCLRHIIINFKLVECVRFRKHFY